MHLWFFNGKLFEITSNIIKNVCKKNKIVADDVAMKKKFIKQNETWQVQMTKKCGISTDNETMQNNCR